MFYINKRIIRDTFLAALLVGPAPVLSLDPAIADSAIPVENQPAVTGYDEVPYYLKKLRETELSDRRLEIIKTIHDALVNADLSDPRVAKKLDDILEGVVAAMKEGYDRTNIAGHAGWLESAVRYVQKLKGEKQIEIDPALIYGLQTTALDGTLIATYPDQIILHEGNDSETVVESAGIREGIISPKGDHIAFIKVPEDESAAEIWVLRLKKKKLRKVASLPSLHSILFSMDGKRVAFQEKPDSLGSESDLGWISAKGGKVHTLGRASLLSTLIKDGKYKGQLVVEKKTPHPLGISDRDCPYLIDWKGRVSGRISSQPCD